MRTRERQTNFIDLFKSFWMPDETEISFEEEIETNSVGLSEEDKKMLKETSSHIKNLEKELYTHSVDKSKRKSRKTKMEQNEMASSKSISPNEKSFLANKSDKDFGERE